MLRLRQLTLYCGLITLLGSNFAQAANLVTDANKLTPGSLPGSIVVDNTGTANYSIPLSVPPGRAGTQPDLSLIYSSGGGDGILGMGWSIGGLSAITRAPNTELDNDGSNTFIPKGVTMDRTDRFLIDNQRMVLVSDGGASSSYGAADTEYRTEVESFSRIYARGQITGRGPEFFEVDTKSGLKMMYGDFLGLGGSGNSSSFIPESSPGDAVLTWSIDRITDSAGNYIDFNYLHDPSATGADAQQQQLDEIVYTYHELQSGYAALNRVKFNYVLRDTVAVNEDSAPVYVGGAKIHMTRLLDSISVQQRASGGSSWVDVWEYRLQYEASPATGKPRLVAIQQVADGGDLAIKETAITYLTNTAPDYEETNVGQMNWFSNSRYIPADMNGDGRTDLIHQYSVNYSDGAGDYNLVKFWQNDGVDSQGNVVWDKSDSWEVTRLTTDSGVLSSGADARVLQTAQLVLGDYDGDGMTDILSVSYAGENLDSNGNPTYAYRRRQLYLNEMDTIGQIGRRDAQGDYTKNPNWSDQGQGIDWNSGFANGYVYNGSLDKYIATDLDKDGITEIIWIKYLNSNVTEDFHIYLWDTPKEDIYDPIDPYNPRKVDFFTDETEMIAFDDNYVEVWDESRAVMGDVNGDGIDDLVLENRYSTGNKTRTRIFITKRNASTGDWYFEAPTGNYDKIDSVTNSWAEHDLLQFADINGDGRSELIRGVPKLTNQTKYYHYWGGGPTSNTFYSIFDYRYHYPHETNSNDPDYWTPELLPLWYTRWWKVGVGYYSYAKNKSLYDGTLALKVYLQKGDGFDLSTPLQENVTIFQQTFTSIDDLRFFFHDETGDGRQDLIAVNVGSDNDGFVRIFASDGDPSGGVFTIDVSEPSEMQGFDNDADWIITDFNGNGFPEITQLAKGNNDSIQFEKFTAPGDLMKTVTNGHGEKTELVHQTLAYDPIYSGAAQILYPVVNFRGPRWIVSDLFKDTGYPTGSGGDVQYHTMYTYGGARVHMQGRGFLGFQTFESYDPQTKLSKIDILEQAYPMTGMTAQTSTYYDPDPLNSGDERILSRADNTVLFDGVVGGTFFPFVSESIEYKWTKDDGLINSDLDPASPTSHYAKITTRNRFDAQSAFLTSQPATDNPANFKITWGNNVSIEIDYGADEGKQTTVNTYDNSSLVDPDWHLARLTEAEVTATAPDPDSSGLLAHQTRTSSFTYDSSTGLLLTETIEPGKGGNEELYTVHVRDAAGRINSTTVTAPGDMSAPARVTTKGGLDSNYMFYTTTTNALGHAETKTFDAKFGSVLTLTGPNGRTTAWEYDALGRAISETSNVGTSLELSTVTQYAFDATAVSIPASIEGSAYQADALYRVTTVGPILSTNLAATQGLSDLRTSGYGMVSTTYYDKMGREIRSESEQLQSGTYASGQTVYADVRADTGYNEIGQVACVSNPYVGSATQWTKTVYDELGRTVEVHVPGSGGGVIVTKTDYDGLSTTVTRNYKSGGTSSTSENQQVISTNNLRGQTVMVTNGLTGNLDNTVTHAYDQFGNLIKSTSPGSNTVRLDYDLRGRKIEQIDPDMGTWEYEYNAFGELIEQTDAKGQVTQMVYDVLGRMTDRYTDYGGANQEHSQWFYDVVDPATDEYGQLRLEIAPDGSRKSYFYDSFGRIDFVLDKILVDASGTTDRWKFYYSVNEYDANYGWLSKASSYWRPLALESLDYMTSATWLYYSTTYHSDSKGSVYAVVGDKSGVDGTTQDTFWWFDPVFNDQGQITEYAMGKDQYGQKLVTTHRTYDQDTHSLSTISTGVGTNGNEIQDMAFDFDNLGNVLYREDNRSGFGLREEFLYDELNRMTQSKVIGGATLDSSYDAQGNILTRDILTSSGVDARSYTYGSSRPHAVTSVTSSLGSWSYGYDANGSIKDRHGVTNAVEWTAYNKVSKVADGSDESVFTHDANHSRITHTVKEGGQDKRRTIYSGAVEQIEEKVSGNWQTVRTRVHVSTPTGSGVIVVEADTTNKDLWMHTDHLGSICEITDDTGSIVESFSYDAWGNRRDSSDWGWVDPATFDPTNTERGFTGHEMLDEVGLVHMNGRIYDALLGRFLSADPILQFPNNGQSFNRYSYVLNNPIKYNDPSGHIIPLLAVPLAASLAASAAASAAITAATIAAIVSVVGMAVAFAGLAAFATVTQGGSTKDILINAGVTFASAVGSAYIGSIFSSYAVTFFADTLALGNAASSFSALAQATATGLFQGGLSEATGGDFGASFVSSFAGTILGAAVASDTAQGLLSHIGGDNWVGGLVSSAVIGGAVSEIAGGKFANGAITGSIAYLFATGFGGSSSESASDTANPTESDADWNWEYHSATWEYDMDLIREEVHFLQVDVGVGVGPGTNVAFGSYEYYAIVGYQGNPLSYQGILLESGVFTSGAVDNFGGIDWSVSGVPLVATGSPHTLSGAGTAFNIGYGPVSVGFVWNGSGQLVGYGAGLSVSPLPIPMGSAYSSETHFAPTYRKYDFDDMIQFRNNKWIHYWNE
ncbi:RHS repeat-associated core domain-containing protein [Cerasicoccus arenae]|uniref:Teneurin-like YD-shell domain-containing protein n=1 Tax=Cerasicoccus arenae TaxID=424488 RepID=A0A8J3DDS9_9BACT|nr:RHS repeat-associated core domain-containing protein [Cerasicoccus arenae]MBK1857755.1 hypothetical protein [Cerasicoccus arenae]GHC11877.1 hypothetical protein GCM10007047_31500 [Cerasicoccus arenae]